MENDKPESLSERYATKEDWHGLRVDLQSWRNDIQLMFAELRSFRAEMLVQFQLVRSEMETQKKELQGQMHGQAREFERSMHAQTWKMVGLIMAVNAAAITAMYYISNS